jgi:hypothetical protein
MPRHGSRARRLTSPVLVALSVALAACSGPAGGPASGSSGEPTPEPTLSIPVTTDPTVFPTPVSSQLAVGPNRFVFSFVDADIAPVASPDRSASVAWVAPGEAVPGPAEDAIFAWGIEGVRGVYVAHPEFSVAGTWTAVFTTSVPGAPTEVIPFRIEIIQEASAVAVGEAAPSTGTPTAADVGGDLTRLSTDPQPLARFYESSEADALAAGRPFVLVFATPAFCQSAQCGPTLDRVKAVSTAYPDLTFINVEPYRLIYVEGRLQPDLDANNGLQPVQAVRDWGILTEPWVYVVDATGIVRGSFEGIVTEAELRAAIDAVAAG